MTHIAYSEAPAGGVFANPLLRDTALLAGRILLAVMFILAGWQKVGGYAGTQAYMASAGVPGFLLPLVILTELGAGLLVLVGYQTRLAAIALFGFTILANFLFHLQPDNQMQMLMFMKNLAIAGGFLALFAVGPGRFSIDRA